MTEADWLACANPAEMLAWMQEKSGHRKMRLVICGWTQCHLKELSKQYCEALLLAEHFADGFADDEARRLADAEIVWASQGKPIPNRHWLVRFGLEQPSDLWEAAKAAVSRNPPTMTRQAAIVRDIFGNPFRPVAIDPAWLTWNHASVPAIARQIYDDRAFHDLPILADALEDAGCTNADLLDHCRGPGPHVRGCWAVDLLVGKS